MRPTPHQKYLIDRLSRHIFGAAIASGQGQSTVEHKRDAKREMERLLDSGVTPLEVKAIVFEIVEEAQNLKKLWSR